MKSCSFPKKIGILFLEKLGSENYKQKFKSHRSKDLDFDKVAFSHLILQMNFKQNLFDFQIVTLVQDDKNEGEDEIFNLNAIFSINKEYFKNEKFITLEKFDAEIAKTEKLAYNSNKENLKKFKDIDYWIGITSKRVAFFKDENGEKKLHGGYFFRTLNKKLESGKFLGLITSIDWDNRFSPPSLFEYIAYTIFICGLYFLNYDYGGFIKPHKDKGCLFDFTYYKPNKRISISNPNLCFDCKYKLQLLEHCIDTKSNDKSNLLDNVYSILNRRWMGSPDIRDTPLFNLKKNYGYDVDRNSGFYKKRWEKLKETTFDNLPNWAGGIVIAVLSAAIIVIVGLKS